jgi:hypothetical protein
VPDIIVPKIVAMRKVAGCLALQVSELWGEEDRAANEWLAGNNAAVNQNDTGLHAAVVTGTGTEIKRKQKRRSRRTANCLGGIRQLWAARNC